MRLYEFEGKKLFQDFKIRVPKGGVAASPQEAMRCAAEIGFPVVLKSQILSGGRGKAGGIKFAKDEKQVAALTKELLGKKIKGYPVEKILVEQKLDIEKEFYLGVTIDRTRYNVAVITSEEGGVDIEEVAAKSPEKIHKLNLSITESMYPYQGIALAKQVGLSGRNIRDFGSITVALFNLFKRYDAKLVEINPLVKVKDGSFFAADSRISIDDDALFRHPELAQMGVEKRHEEGEMTEREKQAREWGIPYLDLDGDIGMFPGGAGFGIMGNDFIIRFGGKPANFMDSGGGPSPERIAKMLVLLDENPNVKAIFGARFGGISRCDDFAKGVVMFLKEHGLSKPMAMRMTGNMWQEGLKIFEEAKKEAPELFKNIEIYGIETPIEEVARRAVELAKKGVQS